jgi:hypothetical protein
MSIIPVHYQEPNRRPSAEMLPFFERRPAAQDLARQSFAFDNSLVGVDRGHDLELRRATHQQEMVFINHQNSLQRIEHQAETETFTAALLANRFRNLQNLAGGVADWCESAASDYEARCQRTPSAAPFLARLLP